MSSTDNQTLPSALAITGNPLVDSLILKGLFALGMIAATWIVSTLKLSDPNAVTWIAGIIAAVLASAAVAAWGWIKSDRDRAAFVQAGINLVASGQAIDTAGNVISTIAPNSTPPKPVTLQTAAVIAKDFAPVTPPKAA